MTETSAMNHDSLPSLLVRMDRIGDLVLTLPTDALIAGPTDWWVAPHLGFVADHSVPPRRIREVPLKTNFAGFRLLLKEVKARQYSQSFVFHAPWWVSVLLWVARIPKRYGVRSQWHSFLFCNHALRQKRSLAEQNELAYNFELVQSSLENTSAEVKSQKGLRLEVDAQWQAETLKELGLNQGSYSVIHPGMGGSARNWPTSHYVSLIQDLTRKETVVITGTANDQQWLNPIRTAIGTNEKVLWLDGKLPGPLLLQVLAGARRVIAPSTGIVHLAASLGIPTFGIFSPVRVQSARRWGPQGPKVETFTPSVECPGTKACLGQQCKQWDCMSTLTVDQLKSSKLFSTTL